MSIRYNTISINAAQRYHNKLLDYLSTWLLDYLTTWLLDYSQSNVPEQALRIVMSLVTWEKDEKGLEFIINLYNTPTQYTHTQILILKKNTKEENQKEENQKKEKKRF